MIIDFHANYNHNSFKNSFRYLTRDENGYAIRCSDCLFDDIEPPRRGGFLLSCVPLGLLVQW